MAGAGSALGTGLGAGDGTTGSGIATSALTEPDGIILNIGDEQVPLGAITQIAPVQP